MAKQFLTGPELMQGNKWLKEIFFPMVKDGHSEFMYDRSYDGAKNFKTVYEAIVNNKWDDIDQALSDIPKYCAFFNVPTNTAMATDEYKLTKQQIAAILANMCRVSQIYWDDTTHTKPELDYFKKTIFGGALWNFNCFVSQDENAKLTGAPKTAAQPKQSSATNTTQSIAQTATQPASSGSKLYLNNCPAVVGNAKVTLTGTEAYWISGEFTQSGGKTKPRIHVSPYMQNAPVKVKYTSGQGFNDCILYWDERNMADAFLQKVIANQPSTVQNLQLKRCSLDSDGYFEITTEFGPALIKAHTLHEMLEEYERQDVEIQECYDNAIKAGSAIKSEEYESYMEEACNKLENFIR